MISCWLAVDEDGTEYMYDSKPHRYIRFWEISWKDGEVNIPLPRGSIKRLTGREMTWAEDPFELKESTAVETITEPQSEA